jgi:hypothetical protein
VCKQTRVVDVKEGEILILNFRSSPGLNSRPTTFFLSNIVHYPLHKDPPFDATLTQVAFKISCLNAVHFGMIFYNNQHNAQVFNLFISLLLPYMFRASF